MRRLLVCASTAAVALVAAPAAHAGHGLATLLDHPAPSFSADAPLSSAFNAGGEGAQWELVTSFPTGNPHTDIDFFTQGGDVFMSAGTLGSGPNGGGQTVLRLTDGGEVAPSFVSSQPSASCVSDPSQALGLQHDVEAAPKGEAILNAPNRRAVRTDTQLLLDATDAPGRCHDQGALGATQAPQGGLELVDVTDVTDPVEIGLTSHIGEAHTVNVDPKRPHIAYAVTSDAVNVDADGNRQNEDPESSEPFDLDGFEVVDFSSCMDFPAGTTVSQKRAACRPEVYRYRFPSAAIALGHTNRNAIYGCHELEVYANDLLTCGSGAAAIVFDMSGAFDRNGKPRGTPLPCRVRDTSSMPPFTTGAKVTDCVVGEGGADLTVPGWLAAGAPSLEGVRYVGSAHHQGRESTTGAVDPAFGSDEDIDFDHELELTGSRRFLLATDERGGGVVPPGASCSPGADNTTGNGGIHAYAVDLLSTDGPGTPEEEWNAYARTPAGDKAIYRAAIRTQPQAAFCTAHVFQQIPGQNRIFMGWYSQGTQVVDFVEHRDGTFEFREAGWFIPENANTWVSHVFKVDENPDGTFTYWGATGDFNFGTTGRSAIDVYKVTLPAPPRAGR